MGTCNNIPSEEFLDSLDPYHAKESNDGSKTETPPLQRPQLTPSLAFVSFNDFVEQQDSSHVSEEQEYVRKPHDKSESSEEVELIEKPLWKSENGYASQNIEVNPVPFKTIDDVISPSSFTRCEPSLVLNEWVQMEPDEIGGK